MPVLFTEGHGVAFRHVGLGRQGSGLPPLASMACVRPVVLGPWVLMDGGVWNVCTEHGYGSVRLPGLGPRTMESATTPLSDPAICGIQRHLPA